MVVVTSNIGCHRCRVDDGGGEVVVVVVVASSMQAVG